MYEQRERMIINRGENTVENMCEHAGCEVGMRLMQRVTELASPKVQIWHKVQWNCQRFEKYE